MVFQLGPVDDPDYENRDGGMQIAVGDEIKGDHDQPLSLRELVTLRAQRFVTAAERWVHPLTMNCPFFARTFVMLHGYFAPGVIT